jgi:hypothetical protein
MPGDSTINQFLSITDDLGRALDSGKEVRVIFCDIRFDHVWHEGLLYKLTPYGVRGNLLRWFRSYLSGRKQKVVINGISSDVANIGAGVPQGSILEPLLFLYDIVLDIRSNI